MTTDEQTAAIASNEQPTIDERKAALLVHGRGCPRAVELGGPAAVEHWCDQQELEVAAEIAEADAAAVFFPTEVSAEAARDATGYDQDEDAEVTRTTGPPTDDAPGPFATPEVIEAIYTRLEELDALVDGGPVTLAHVVEAYPSLLTRLTALETAVDALAASGPTEAQVGAVAAGGEPRPKVTPGKPRKGRKKAEKK